MTPIASGCTTHALCAGCLRKLYPTPGNTFDGLERDGVPIHSLVLRLDAVLLQYVRRVGQGQLRRSRYLDRHFSTWYCDVCRLTRLAAGATPLT
jgi:hypothetical protein